MKKTSSFAAAALFLFSALVLPAADAPTPPAPPDLAARRAAAQKLIDGLKPQHGEVTLRGGVAKINVGAATESEMKEKKMRVEDAMHATRAAHQEGILPGGGVALLRAAQDLKPKGLGSDEEAGYNIVVRSCRAPITQISANAGLNGEVVANKVLEKGDQNHGYDAREDRYCDMVKEGIIDPTKVVRSALQNAASIAGLMLTTEALITEIPEKKEKPAADPHHGGGMDY